MVDAPREPNLLRIETVIHIVRFGLEMYTEKSSRKLNVDAFRNRQH